MDISAGVLVREGKIIRRGPRQVERTVFELLKIMGPQKCLTCITIEKIFISTWSFTFRLSRLARSLQCSCVFPTTLVLFSIPLETKHRLT